MVVTFNSTLLYKPLLGNVLLSSGPLAQVDFISFPRKALQTFGSAKGPSSFL